MLIIPTVLTLLSIIGFYFIADSTYEGLTEKFDDNIAG